MAALFGAVVPGAGRADPANPLTDLLDVAAQRLQIADPVAAAKWRTGAAIEDPARVAQQLSALAEKADTAGLDPDYVRRVFTDQIAATEAVEYRRFADWKLDPATAPAGAPELTASRTELDRLNQIMLDQIGRRWAVLHSPACPGQLGAARRATGAERGLDAFEQQALTVATRSYCRV